MTSERVAGDEVSPTAACLLTFFALAFAWSWACWWLAPALEADTPVLATALSLTGGFGPSLAALAVVTYCNGTAGLRRWLKRCLQWRLGWRLGWRWVVLAFFLPAAIMGLAVAVHVASGGTLSASQAAGQMGMAAVNFGLIFLVGGPLGEEFGWRGYAQPALQKRWGWRVASLFLVGVWAIWHLPLFYTTGTAQSSLAMGLHTVSVIASSVLFAWLFNRSQGSIISVLLLHTAVNAFPMLIPVMVQPDGSNLRPFQIVVGFQVLVAIVLLVFGNRLFKTHPD